jgi:hypothetical protein
MGRILRTIPFLAFSIAACTESTSPADEAQEFEIAPIDVTDFTQESGPDGDAIEIAPIDMPSDHGPDDMPPAEELPPSPIGGPCMSAENCVPPPGLTSFCLTSILIFQFPGGYCTAQCSAPGECGTDAECVDLSIIRYCVRKCSGPSDCRIDEGYTCNTIPYITDTNTYCIPQV